MSQTRDNEAALTESMQELFDILKHLPFKLQPAPVSGLYVHEQQTIKVPWPIPIEKIPKIPVPDPGPLPFGHATGDASSAEAGDGIGEAGFFKFGMGGELRLDVDGRYPQMVASGTLQSGLFQRAQWIAHLTTVSALHWSGSVFYKHGTASLLPYSDVSITVSRPGPLLTPTSATVVFSGGGSSGLTLTYDHRSNAFHDVEMEFDSATGVSAVTTVNTGAHPNRPATLPVETLSIEDIYRRAGFHVTRTSSGTVPLSGAGADAKWSDTEMHDAMQVYWSRFANTAQWSVWTFFAALSDQGTGLGGIMFDDIGAQHRQGTAIFENSFISNLPAGDPNGAAFVERMRFWTAVHELGHTFNLAHAWQKSLVSGGGGPWLPLADEPESRSFMNYPYNVNGGSTAFFSDFAYRFSNDELLFLRHAPGQFVEQGNAAWFENHGFEQANVSPEPKLALELRVHRDDWDRIPTFSFLEPVYLETKLANVSNEPVIVDEHVLLDRASMVIVVKREGRDAQVRLPHAQYCNTRQPRVLAAGEAIYESVLVSVSKGGFLIDEPGRYVIQMVIELPSGEHVVSNSLVVRVAPPKAREHELLASDYFTDDVARIFAFGGSRELASGNHALEEVTARMADEPVARHARLALGRPLSVPFKRLDVAGRTPVPMSAAFAGGSIVIEKPDVKMAEEHLHGALDNAPAAAQTLGHIRFKRAVERFASLLEDQGEHLTAASVLDEARQTLAARGVIQPVLDELAARHKSVKAESRPTSRKK